MTEDFKADVREAQERMAAQLAKKRKKSPLEKLASVVAPILTVFNPLAGTILGGLTGAGGAIEDVKAAKDSIKLAESMGLDMNKFKSTFLEQGALDQQSLFKTNLDTARASIDDNPLNFIKAGLGSAAQAYSIGTGLSSIGAGAKASTIAGQGYSVDPTYGATGLASIDYSQLLPNIMKEYKTRMLAPGANTLEDLQKLLTAGGIGIR
tara:strand:- start:1073 stop:1696 length:624 start_codon:yes stop_codon:yes gene_type:complete